MFYNLGARPRLVFNHSYIVKSGSFMAWLIPIAVQQSIVCSYIYFVVDEVLNVRKNLDS